MSTNHDTHNPDDHSARLRLAELERKGADARPPDPAKHLWVEPYTLTAERALHPGDSLTVVNHCDREIKVCTGRLLTDWRGTLAAGEIERLKAERDKYRVTAEYLEARRKVDEAEWVKAEAERDRAIAERESYVQALARYMENIDASFRDARDELGRAIGWSFGDGKLLDEAAQMAVGYIEARHKEIDELEAERDKLKEERDRLYSIIVASPNAIVDHVNKWVAESTSLEAKSRLIDAANRSASFAAACRIAKELRAERGELRASLLRLARLVDSGDRAGAVEMSRELLSGGEIEEEIEESS